MLSRLIASLGLLALGYYVGKQVGRMEPIREELEQARRSKETADDAGTDAPAVDHPTDSMT